MKILNLIRFSKRLQTHQNACIRGKRLSPVFSKTQLISTPHVVSFPFLWIVRDISWANSCKSLGKVCMPHFLFWIKIITVTMFVYDCDMLFLFSLSIVQMFITSCLISHFYTCFPFIYDLMIFKRWFFYEAFAFFPGCKCVQMFYIRL